MFQKKEKDSYFTNTISAINVQTFIVTRPILVRPFGEKGATRNTITITIVTDLLTVMND